MTQSASQAGPCTCISCCLPSSIPGPARANNCQRRDALEVSLQTSELLNKVQPEQFSYVEEAFLISCSFGVFFWGRDSESCQDTTRELKKTHRKTSSKESIITVRILIITKHTKPLQTHKKWPKLATEQAKREKLV